MTKFEVTDAMLDAAEQAYDTIAAIEHDAWCYTAPTRAAISAAFEASGLVEENARLREALDQIACAKRVSLDGVVVFESWHEFAERLQEIAEQALNKEPTNDQ
jgi:hypothetical protein